MSSQNRKATGNTSMTPTANHDRSLKLKDEYRNTSKINKNNKENETPKDKKNLSSNQSKLLLDRYNNNKRLSKGSVSSASTMALNNIQPRSKETESRPPLNPNSPKNALTVIRQNTFQGTTIESK
jgi:hypothetical protein